MLRCHTPAHVERIAADRARDLARRRHGRERDLVRGRPARGRDGDPGGRRKERSRSSARPATTRCPTARWASASSTTSRSRPAGPRPSSACDASRSSTGTSTTATGRRRSSGTTRPSSSRRCTSGRSTPAPAGRTSRTRRRSTSRSPAGSGDDEFLGALDELVAPALARFEPELLLVSAGFDAHASDPLALMEVSEDGFRELARRSATLRAARRRGAGGRLQPRDAALARRGRARGVFGMRKAGFRRPFDSRWNCRSPLS